MLGVEGLSRSYDNARPSGARLAALFAVLPGMGAVTIARTSKRLSLRFDHRPVSARKHQVAAGVFALGGIVFYLYSIIDAYRTAMLIARGDSPAVDEERFKRSLIKRAPLIGVMLIAGGLLLVVQILRPFAFVTVTRLFPVALIILGGYLLTRYFKRSREESYEPQPSAPRTRWCPQIQ
jgi:hypothetical protein